MSFVEYGLSLIIEKFEYIDRLEKNTTKLLKVLIKLKRDNPSDVDRCECKCSSDYTSVSLTFKKTDRMSINIKLKKI